MGWRRACPPPCEELRSGVLVLDGDGLAQEPYGDAPARVEAVFLFPEDLVGAVEEDRREDDRAEDECEADPHPAPGGGFPEGDDMRVPVGDQVQGQRHEHGDGERRPEPERDIEHQRTPHMSGGETGSPLCWPED